MASKILSQTDQQSLSLSMKIQNYVMLKTTTNSIHSHRSSVSQEKNNSANVISSSKISVNEISSP